MIHIAVDARPLRHPNSGIGKYTKKMLEYLGQQPEVQLTLLGRQKKLSRFAQVLDTVWAMCAFGLLARRKNADLYWSPRHHLPLGLGSMASVVTVHDVVYKAWPATMPFFNRLNERLLMPRSVKAASRVIVPSESTRREVTDHFGLSSDRVVHIPMGADPVALSSETSVAQVVPPAFLFVGGDQPRKNLNACIDAAQLMHQQAPDAIWQICVAGYVQDLARLESQLQVAGVSARFVLLGELSEPELETHFASCYALLMPSLHEGFGLPVLEAARYAKPAVVSSGTALDEFADGTVCIAAQDADSLAAAMLRLLQDPEHYARLSQGALRFSAGLTWAATGAKTLQLFTQLGPT